MGKYLLIIALVCFIYIVSKEVYYKIIKSNKLVKSSKAYKIYYIIFSICWFLIGFSNLKGNSALYLSLSQILLGSMFLLRSFQRDFIYDYGISTSKGNYKWKRISDYKWEYYENVNTNKGNIEYHYLSFYIIRNKYSSFITSDSYKKVTLEISEKNKTKTQNLLDTYFKHDDVKL